MIGIQHLVTEMIGHSISDMIGLKHLVTELIGQAQTTHGASLAPSLFQTSLKLNKGQFQG